MSASTESGITLAEVVEAADIFWLLFGAILVFCEYRPFSVTDSTSCYRVAIFSGAVTDTTSCTPVSSRQMNDWFVMVRLALVELRWVIRRASAALQELSCLFFNECR